MKFLFAMILSLGAYAAHAQDYGYEYDYEDYSSESEPAVQLANLSVGPAMRRYSVRVRNCAETVSSIMLRIREAGLQINGAGVTFTDGTSDGFSISYTFPANYDSSWISIDSFKEAGKCINAVYVNAQSTDPGRNSRVTVFGN